MKRSEAILLICVALAGLIFFGDQYGLFDRASRLFTSDSVELDALLERNQQFRDSLRNIGRIESEFEAIESIFDTGSTAEAKSAGTDAPAAATGSERSRFVEQLVEICKACGQDRPGIDPPAPEPIPDVSEYQYVTVEMNLRNMPEAEFQRFMALLEENNIILMRLRVVNQIDRDSLSIGCNVARIQPVEAKPATEAAAQ